MTIEKMKVWIDSASYEQLLSRWRFEPFGSPWFQGEVGDYYSAAMNNKRVETSHEEQIAASKKIGW